MSVYTEAIAQSHEHTAVLWILLGDAKPQRRGRTPWASSSATRNRTRLIPLRFMSGFLLSHEHLTRNVAWNSDHPCLPTPSARHRPITLIDRTAALVAVMRTARSGGNRLHASRSRKPPFSFREEFRTPLGVRKSPRNEPAVCGPRLWGFE
jgi:hypothetical protein